MDTTQFFYRNVIFSKRGNTISLIDLFQPKSESEELDPWFGMVLQLADGQHSIDQLHEYISTLYSGSPPDNLEDTLHSVVQRMSKSGLIVLTESETELPYYLSMPYEMLDVEKAKRLIKEDREKYKDDKAE